MSAAPPPILTQEQLQAQLVGFVEASALIPCPPNKIRDRLQQLGVRVIHVGGHYMMYRHELMAAIERRQARTNGQRAAA